MAFKWSKSGNSIANGSFERWARASACCKRSHKSALIRQTGQHVQGSHLITGFVRRAFMHHRKQTLLGAKLNRAALRQNPSATGIRRRIMIAEVKATCFGSIFQNPL